VCSCDHVLTPCVFHKKEGSLKTIRGMMMVVSELLYFSNKMEDIFYKKHIFNIPRNTVSGTLILGNSRSANSS
jgi:hypothetical protein